MKNENMLLTIDIGNTTISLGLFEGSKIISSMYLNNIDRKELIKNIKKLKRYNIGKCLACSVVPNLNRKIKNLFKKELGLDVRFAGTDLKVPIKNNYKNPRQVGQDRLVGAYAAKMLYDTPAIVVDFGTAITFDIVSKNGSYEGGLIVPGIRLSLESLYSKTALLPQIREIKTPKRLVGKCTKESILSGVFNGYGVMCAGIVNLLSKKYKWAKIILIGGYAKRMKKYIKLNYVVENNLVLKGLCFLAQAKLSKKNKASKNFS